jgi:hypothetical protein
VVTPPTVVVVKPTCNHVEVKEVEVRKVEVKKVEVKKVEVKATAPTPATKSGTCQKK